MASCKLQGKTFTISEKAEKDYFKVIGGPITEADIYVFLYSAYNSLSEDNPDVQISDITNEDLENEMYSELELYANYTEGT